MFNVVIGCVIVAFTTYLGYAVSKKYYFKRKFYQSFYDFNLIMKSEIAFGRNTVKSIIEKNDDGGEFYKKIKRYVENEKYERVDYFAESDNDFVLNYYKTIGEGDAVSQTKFVDGADGRLKKYLEEACLNEKKYRTLYLKLGFMVGLIIMIIIL